MSQAISYSLAQQQIKWAQCLMPLPKPPRSPVHMIGLQALAHLILSPAYVFGAAMWCIAAPFRGIAYAYEWAVWMVAPLPEHD